MVDELAVDIRDGIFGGVAGPGDALFRIENGNIGFGATFDEYETSVALPALLLRHQPSLQIQGFGDGSGEADGLQIGRQPTQAGKAKREHMATL